MTESTTRITLVRHGHVHNPDNLVYGRLPGFRLSTVGRKQAASAAAHLSSVHLAALFCSPQLRAQETGEHLLQHHPPGRKRHRGQRHIPLAAARGQVLQVAHALSRHG